MSCEIFNNSDFGMIEGSQQTITLDLYTILGEEFKNVAIESVEWRMSRYGETECLVSKTSTDNQDEVEYEENVITITLLPSDTNTLYAPKEHSHPKYTTESEVKSIVRSMVKSKYLNG